MKRARIVLAPPTRCKQMSAQPDPIRADSTSGGFTVAGTSLAAYPCGSWSCQQAFTASTVGELPTHPSPANRGGA
jgi:hypothetical protein